MSKFDKKSSKGSVPNWRLQICNRYAIRWFKCKLKPPKNSKRKCSDEMDQDDVNIGKKSKVISNRSQDRSRSAKVNKATVSKQPIKIKENPKRSNSDVRKVIITRQNKIGANNNAIPEKLANVCSKINKTGKKDRFETKTKDIAKAKGIANAEQMKQINDDGVLLDVDDSEFNDGLENTTTRDENEDSDVGEDETVSLGATASTANTEKDEAVKAKKLLAEHPELKHLINQMLDDRMKDMKETTKSNDIASKTTGNEKEATMVEPVDINRTPKEQRKSNNLIVNKSPSDTTLYKPIFRRENTVAMIPEVVPVVQEQISTQSQSPPASIEESSNENETEMEIEPVRQNETNETISGKNKPSSSEARNSFDHKRLMEKISTFVDNLRMDVERHEAIDEYQPEPSTSGGRRRSEVTVPGQQEARAKVDRPVLESEKFKATIQNPPGTNYDYRMYSNQDSYTEQESGETELMNLDRIIKSIDKIPCSTEVKSDDDFLHIMCHVDQSLVNKIEKGEFVDLERLLPKERFTNRPANNEQRMEWVRSEEGTFLVPTQDKSTKINSFKRWEQAFRIYATIYCGANPSRAKEIWQYVSVISTASSSFIWDNVANYDFTFCQLMAYNPNRSWAIMYHHMWSL